MIDYRAVGMGKVFEDLRRTHQWNQEEIAFRCRRNSNTISDLERDESLPQLDTFINMAFVLDMKPSELMAKIEKRTTLLDYKDCFKDKDED